MLPALHFVALVVLPVVVGAVVRRSFSSPTPARVMAALAFGGACGLIGLAQLHHCDEGVPLAQWLLPGAAATFSMLFIGAARARRTLAALAVLVAIVLSTTFTTAVHGSVYTGNPRPHEGASPRAEWHSFVTGLYRR